LQIKGLPREERPRERLVAHGAAALADAELLALVLGCGNAGASALDLARRLVVDAGGLRKLASRTVPEWEVEPGVGEALASRLAAVFEISRRLRVRPPRRGQPVRHPQQMASYLGARLADAQSESFGVLLLDARNRLLGDDVLSRGGWSASVVRPREVFRRALLAGAPALILYHNHPSGDPAPSREDIQITRQLVEAGQLLGIKVLDHLIVGVEGYASLRERGLL
jgi:DNA repair protein RadC